MNEWFWILKLKLYHNNQPQWLVWQRSEIEREKKTKITKNNRKIWSKMRIMKDETMMMVTTSMRILDGKILLKTTLTFSCYSKNINGFSIYVLYRLNFSEFFDSFCLWIFYYCADMRFANVSHYNHRHYHHHHHQ